MNGLTLPNARNTNIVVQELNKEILIYDSDANKAFCLNETSNLVWQMCNGNNSVGDISKELGKKLKTSVPEDLIWLAIEQLKKDNLLENSDEVEIKFTELSRRDVIRKVGLASVIALPLISSLIAPPAAAAQSPGACLAVGKTCSVGANCCTGRCEGTCY